MEDLSPPRQGLGRGVTIATRLVYALFGAFYLVLGITVLLLGTGVLPVWVHDRIFEMGHHTPDTMHLIQETGTLWILVGMLLLISRATSIAARRFIGPLRSISRWTPGCTGSTRYGEFEHEPRAVINAIPFVVFLVVGLLRRAVRA